MVNKVLSLLHRNNPIQDGDPHKERPRSSGDQFFGFFSRYIQSMVNNSGSLLDHLEDINHYGYQKLVSLFQVSALFGRTIVRAKEPFDNFEHRHTAHASDLDFDQSKQSHLQLPDSSELVSNCKENTPAILVSIYSILQMGCAALPSSFHRAISHLVAQIAKREFIEMPLLDCIDNILKRHPACTTEFHRFMHMCLELEDPDSTEQPLALSILRHLDKFHLSHDADLISLLLEHLSIFERKEDMSVADKVYYKCLLLERNPPVLNFSTTCFLDEQMKISLQGLKSLFSSSKITIDQVRNIVRSLPLGPDLLHHVLKRFDAIINKMSVQEKKQISAHVMTCSNDSLENVRNSFSDIFFYSLLSPFNSSSLSREGALFSAFLVFLMDKESSEDFIECCSKLSVSIQNCHLGKKEAIYIAYHQLPSEYKYKSESGIISSPSIEFLHDKIRDVLEKRFYHIVSGDQTLLSDITGCPKSIPELAHNSNYVKNIICPIVGMDHQIQYDPKAHLISKILLEKTPQEIFTAFLKYFSIDILVKDIKEMYLQEAMLSPEKGNKIYYSINQIFELLSFPLDKGWDLIDDHEIVSQLTSDGVLKILKYFNVI
ncbi:MAG: hypothetical protein FJZ57_02325 [Chlamydiae bacterium]|nr:hypothetical protein [Chlamydiota bacterium]